MTGLCGGGGAANLPRSRLVSPLEANSAKLGLEVFLE
jgi:hypothetical protein